MISSEVPRLRVLVAKDISYILEGMVERERNTLVGALLQLAIVRCLLDEIEQLGGQGFISNGPRWESVSR